MTYRVIVINGLGIKVGVVQLASNRHLLQRQPYDFIQEPRLCRVRRRAEIAVGDRHVSDRH